jgi:hypothetical protein
MVRARPAAGILAFLLFFAPAVKAQQQALQSTATPSPQTQSQPQSQPPTADAMGVSLKNIRRQASAPPGAERPPGDGLRYDFFVDVFGKRPAIDFFKDFDLSKGGAVRYGGVTHQEILDAATPYPFHIYTGGINVLPSGKKK